MPLKLYLPLRLGRLSTTSPVNGFMMKISSSSELADTTTQPSLEERKMSRSSSVSNVSTRSVYYSDRRGSNILHVPSCFEQYMSQGQTFACSSWLGTFLHVLQTAEKRIRSTKDRLETTSSSKSFGRSCHGATEVPSTSSAWAGGGEERERRKKKLFTALVSPFSTDLNSQFSDHCRSERA